MTSPRRRTDLILRDHTFADGRVGLLAYDARADTGHVLDPVPAAVLQQADGNAGVGELAARVARITGTPVDEAAVTDALADLSVAGLLADAPALDGHVSRRKVLAGVAVGVAAVAVAPAIVSVARPKQAAAQVPDPLAVQPKSATTPQGTPVDVTLTHSGGVGGTTVVYVQASPPSHGTVSITGDVATYTPDPGFTGTDTFTYTAAECLIVLGVAIPGCPVGTTPVPPSGATPATVTITVTAPPTTTAPPSTTTTTTPPPSASPSAVRAQPRFTG